MRKTLVLVLGAIILLLGLGTIGGVVKWTTYITKSSSGTETLEGPPGIEWRYNSVAVPTDGTVKISVSAQEAGDRVLLGIMAEDTFKAGGPWSEGQLLESTTGSDVSVSWTREAPGKGTYYWLVQGYENWPIPFDYTVKLKKPRYIESYLGAGLTVLGALLLVWGYRRRK